MAVNQNGGGLTLEGRKASIPIRSIKIPGQPIPTIVLQTRPTLPSWLEGREEGRLKLSVQVFRAWMEEKRLRIERVCRHGRIKLFYFVS